MKTRASLSRAGLEGALMVLSPFPLILSLPGGVSGHPDVWRLVLGFCAVLLCLLCALTVFRRPCAGKLFGAGAALAGYGTAFPYIVASPFAALAGSVSLVFILFVLLGADVDLRGERSSHVERCLRRARWAVLAAPAVAVMVVLIGPSANKLALACAAAAAFIAQLLFLHWSITIKSAWRSACSVGAISGVALALPFVATPLLIGLIFSLSLAAVLLMPEYRPGVFSREERWWEILVNHPGRILFTTFFSLCLLGTLLLIIPASTEKDAITLIDAVFTAVSAVCVTGLIVLDTPNDFTVTGQVFILVLIQLGGLGIMSITTVALHAMGRRLSLRHEKLLATMTDSSHQDLVHSLVTILKVTIVAEGLGAMVLSLSFYFAGDLPAQAVWKGAFTAVSAFCNAGFALQSDSLISYQANPLVLHTVAVLVVLGGMAPATSLVIPRWLMGKSIPIPARIALVASGGFLASGTLLLLAFEWNGVLAGLPFADKLQNAWFQSVTLRTAGFNSVDIANLSGPAFLMMIAFMFIGGSPGGTAGGVKTVTIGILAMTFWANIANRNQIVTQNRRIHPDTVQRAVTVVVSGVAVWFLAVIMLEVTQNISSRHLIFEATSAIGTVGLSTGATPLLDEIGKVIIIIAMFVGRIGPISLFMLLNDEQMVSDTRYPVERVSIT